MKIYKTIKDFIETAPAEHKNAAIAIGNFDGVHRGHQKLLNTVKNTAQNQNKSAGVLTFSPHPRKLFRSDDPPFRITPDSLREEKLAETGIDFAVILEFNWDFASQSADNFIQTILKEGINPSYIAVGEDFCFGQMRKGNVESLKQAGFNVITVKKEADENGQIISSSAIRQALRHADIKKANELLGWHWEMRGKIVKGDQRGRELGYPTANVPMGETLHPAYGIYATSVQIMDDGKDAPWLTAATNIGIRPMFELKVGQIEAHILDFDRDIYGCTLRVRPIEKIRGEAKFKSLDDLIAQMALDCAKTRTILEKES